MFQTIEECRSAWEAAGKHGTKSERIARNQKWIQYYQGVAQTQKDSLADRDPHAEEVVRGLTEAGWLTRGDSVFDIGAGTGKYALAFAKNAGQVTALEMDEASLCVLKSHAEQLGLTNIQCELGMWEAYQPNERFAVAFSSMCPAICDYDELLKMESIATRTCCLVAVTRGSYDLHRKKLMQLLCVKPEGGMTTEALWYYEMLYLMGRQPDVKNETRHFEYTLPVDEACQRNEAYFQIFGIPAAQSRPVLHEYFNERAENGLVYDETHLNTALICWRPPKGNE